MKPNTIILIVATLIVAGGAYWFFFTGNSDSGNDLPITASASVNKSQALFQQLASQLKPISFNVSIFSDARFMSLVDLTTQITDETKGRLDPFAPVSGVTER